MLHQIRVNARDTGNSATTGAWTFSGPVSPVPVFSVVVSPPPAFAEMACPFKQEAIRSRSASPDAIGPMNKQPPLDHLRSLVFTPPTTLDLTFPDKTFSLDVTALDVPANRLDWRTAKTLPNETGLAVDVINNNEKIAIDAATLRYLVDPQYAAQIDQSIRDLHMTPAEAEEASRLSLLTRDHRWYDVGDEGDLLD
ncbi:MAG: hypothetical protein U0793_19740 [Gemmataceae bacterium]